MIGIDQIVGHWSFADAFEKTTISAITSSGNICNRRVWFGMPIIPPDLLRCCFYLYKTRAAARNGVPFGGTGFVYGIRSTVDERQYHAFGITNWHVAVRDGYSVIRLNKRDGTTDIIERDPSEWIWRRKWHDIAVIRLDDLDARYHDLMGIDDGMALRRDEIDELEIWAGADVFMVGRFVDHDGRTTNIPSARFGNISVMPVGGIEQPTGSTLESYVLDVHSRTGYSGSPVFVYQTIGSDLRLPSGTVSTRQFVRLLGIHWGQFQEKWIITPSGKARSSSSSVKNKQQRRFIGSAAIDGLSGMTCAVPSWSIVELFEDPKLRTIIDEGEEELRARPFNPRGEISETA